MQTINPADFTKNYMFGFEHPSGAAKDVVFLFPLANQTGVTLTVTPTASLNVSVEVTTTSECGRFNTQFADVRAAGGVEVVAKNNTLGAPLVALFIVHAEGTGTFDVLATASAAPVACNSTTCAHGCCAGTNCEQGDGWRMPGVCGIGGAACVFCGAGELCRSHVCTPITGVTGGVCVQASQCYAPVLGTATCESYWPSGGYCWSTCSFPNTVCGSPTALGWCTSELQCLSRCSTPGSGRGTCPEGYLCDHSNPASSSSQGVCKPECGRTGCGGGLRACRPDGLCR